MPNAKSSDKDTTDPGVVRRERRRNRAVEAGARSADPALSVQVSRDRKILSMHAKGAPALILAVAFGGGLLAWAILSLAKLVR